MKGTSKMKTGIIITLLSSLLFGVEVFAKDAAEEKSELKTQTTCPVMEGNPINKNLYVDYQGKRVYFCCKSCVEIFQKDPDKYLTQLPQFESQEIDEQQNDSHEHNDDLEHTHVAIAWFKPHKLIAPLGISTLTALLLTFLTGLFRRRLGRLFLGVHKLLAFLTLILAVLHALLVLVFN